MIFYLLNTNQIIKLFEKMGYTITEEHIIKNIYYYLERYYLRKKLDYINYHRTSHGSTLSMIVYSGNEKIKKKNLYNIILAILHNYNLNKSWELYKSFIQSDIEDTQHGTTPEGYFILLLNYKNYLGFHVAPMAASINLLITHYSG